MRFTRSQLRNTIKNGQHRVLTTYASCSRQPFRCISSVSALGSHRDLCRSGTAWPSTCHAVQLRNSVYSIRQKSTARHNSTAAAAEIPDQDSDGTTALEEPEKDSQDDAGDKEPPENEKLLQQVKDAYEASEKVPFFPYGFVLSSRKASQDLHAFFQSESRIASFAQDQLTLKLLRNFSKDLRLHVFVIDKKHIPHGRDDAGRSAGAPLRILVRKTSSFVLPPENIRRDLDREIESFISGCLHGTTVKKMFHRHLYNVHRYNRGSLLRNGHSLIIAACRDDINRIPILTLVDKAGDPVSLSKDEAGDLVSLKSTDPWPLRLILSDTNEVRAEHDILNKGALGALRDKFAQSMLNWLDPSKNAARNRPSSREQFHFLADEWTPGEYLARAARALNYGYVTCDQELVTPPIPRTEEDGEAISFYRTTIGMSDHRFDCKALWTTAKASKKIAVLQACIAIKPQLTAAFESGKLLPEDYQRFAKYWKKPEAAPLENFQIANSSFSTALIDARSITRMLGVLKDLRDLDQEEKVTDWQAIDESLFEPAPMQVGHRSIGITRPGPRADVMARMRAIKATLPITQSNYKQLIRDSVRDNDVTIIKATTGSGKTTQVPQFLLDEITEQSPNIVCTQPRRIAAISVAKRVADERGQPVGDQVGFQVRFKDEAPTASSGINYMTAGFLLRLFEADPKWICNHYTHIIFDEVHERDLDTDLLLTGMKNLMLHKPVEGLRIPKLVLMSATIDADKLVQYFNDCKIPPSVASIDVPGKTYAVSTTMLEEFWPRLLTKYPDAMGSPKQIHMMKEYIEDQLSAPKQKTMSVPGPAPDSEEGDAEESDISEEAAAQLLVEKEDRFIVPIPMLTYLIKDVLQQTETGDVLVFLPGLSEIDTLAEEVIGKIGSHHLVSKLHSSFGDSNFDAWEPTAPGIRRVFLSTNIAETSITLPGVTVVIDTGYSKQGDFDQASQVESFGHRWISKAEVAQRRGRAGRTREGQYFATYSRKQYDSMADSQVPEILRSNLTPIVLRTENGKAFRRPEGSDLARPGGVLELAPSVPERQDVDASVEQLKRLRALTPGHKVTPLGALLSRLPIEPELGRLVLMSLLFRCLGPGILAASYTPDNPLLHHPEKVSDVARARKEFAGKTYDDRLGDAAAFISYAMADLKQNTEEKHRLERENYLRLSAFTGMTRYTSQLIDSVMNIMDIPRRIGRDYNTTPIINSLFTGSMAFPNTNSSSADLVKALIIASSGTRVAKWDGKNWRNEKSYRVMPSPRSVNHDGSKRELRAANAIRREPGDLLCYLNLRKSPDGPAWAHETTVMSPLGAMLFAESLRLADEDVLIVNDWIKYKVEPQGELKFTPAEVAKIILEFRKALDRFLAQAFSDVCPAPARLAVVRSGAVKANKFNTFLRNSATPVRELFANSLVEIFKLDKEKKQERKEKRRAAAEADAPDDSKLKLFLQQLKDKV